MMNGFTMGLLAGMMINTPTGKKLAGTLEKKLAEIAKAATDKEADDGQQKDSGETSDS